MQRSSTVSVILAIIFIIMAFIAIKYLDNPFGNIKKSENIGISGYNYDIDYNLIDLDLNTYNKLSPAVISELLIDIKEASEKYSIPPGLLHAIFRVESEYNFWIEHPIVHIKVNGKEVITRAIGLGGVIWDFWEEELIKQNIAYKRSDLFIIKNNVTATAAILRFIINKRAKASKITKYSAIYEIISGYYGAYDVDYHNKMIKVTSDLWIKRVAHDIINDLNKNKMSRSNDQKRK